MNITAKEHAVLQAILRNDYTRFNGSVPDADYVFDEGHFEVWSDCIHLCDGSKDLGLPKGRALSAVVSSLAQKGLISSDGECVILRKAGFDAAMDAIRPAL